ncbi:YopX family protein [Enterococcus entomosocium]|uniref:YopX family protein n=1 Tax=Enterococcus entomosocium TaxID=3034352 RepID=UPI003BE39452
MLLNVYNLRNVFIRPETCGLVLMQSTGLKDKNGVEIFEGDLVKKFSNINKFTDDFAEVIEPICVITSIVRDGACFKTTFKGVPSFVLDQNSMSMVEHMEVVGNIYENPELLEQANEN